MHHPDLRTLFWMRGLRAYGDGYVSLLLPVYLAQLGYSPAEIGWMTTATLLGAGMSALGVGAAASHWRRRPLFQVASWLMVATGVGFAALSAYGPLLIVAFAGTLNPSNADVGAFMPLEQSAISQVVPDRARTSAFARCTVVAYLAESVGELSAVVPDWSGYLGIERAVAIRLMFVAYAGLGVAVWLLSRRLSEKIELAQRKVEGGLGQSRKTAYVLASLFGLDSFASGFVVQSLLALWLFRRFGLSLSAASAVFSCSSLLSAAALPLAPRLARKLGLIKTMVSAHVAANVCLIAVALVPNLPWALAALLARSVLSQLDTPAKRSYVMGIVPEAERAAVASVTNAPRSFAAAGSPAIAGHLLNLSSFGWPLVIGGGLKIAYDAMLYLAFRDRRPPEEQSGS